MKIQPIINVPNGLPPKDKPKLYPNEPVIIWNKSSVDTFERRKPVFGMKVNTNNKRRY